MLPRTTLPAGRFGRARRAPEVPKRPVLLYVVALVTLRRLRRFDLSSRGRCARRGWLLSGTRWAGD